jgi:hypothetical protein
MSSKPAKSKVIKFEAKLDKFAPQSGWHFIPVSKEIADRLAFPDKNKRVVCTLNGTETWQCALMPYQGEFFILVNKQKRTKVGIELGDIVLVELVRDESRYGLPMPEELREVLKQDRQGDKLFHALTPGKQRSLIYHVSNIKDIDRRIHACLIIVDHLTKNKGKIIDQRLYEDLKRPIG